MHVETMGIPGHPTQRVEKETGLDSVLSFILVIFLFVLKD